MDTIGVLYKMGPNCDLLIANSFPSKIWKIDHFIECQYGGRGSVHCGCDTLSWPRAIMKLHIAMLFNLKRFLWITPSLSLSLSLSLWFIPWIDFFSSFSFSFFHSRQSSFISHLIFYARMPLFLYLSSYVVLQYLRRCLLLFNIIISKQRNRKHDLCI